MINKIGNPQEKRQIIVNSKEMGQIYPTDMKTVIKITQNNSIDKWDLLNEIIVGTTNAL